MYADAVVGHEVMVTVVNGLGEGVLDHERHQMAMTKIMMTVVSMRVKNSVRWGM